MHFLGWRLNHWFGLGACALAAAVFPILLHGWKFYDLDDAQTQFLPAFHEIGRQLSAGQLPLISLRSWFGGNLVGEYQYAIFNPISDLLYVMLYQSPLDFDQQAACFAVFHLLNLAAGTFVACKALRCRFDEALFATLLASNGIWLSYWAAMTWLPLLAALSWCAWAVAGLIWLQHNRRWVLGTTLAIALTGLSGSPQIDIALALIGAIFTLFRLLRKDFASLAATLAALVLGLAMALPALLPLIDALGASTRPMLFSADGYFLPLQAIAALGLPVFLSAWPDWRNHWHLLALPQAYLDWSFPLLIVAAVRSPRGIARDPMLLALGAAMLALLLLAMIPAIGTFRYPMRFIPAAFLMAGLATGRYLALRRKRGCPGHGWTWPLVLSVVSVMTIIAVAFCTDIAGNSLPILLGAALVLSLAALVLTLPKPAQPHWIRMLCGLHLLIYAGITSFWAANPSLSHFALPNRIAPDDLSGLSSSGNNLFLFRNRDMTGLTHDRWRVYGNASFALDVPAISGYSALGPSSVEAFFGFTHIGDSTLPYLDRLFQREPWTGQSYARLFRIERVIAETPDWIDMADRATPADWKRTAWPSEGKALLLTAPPGTASLAGTLSFLPTGVTAELQQFSDRREIWRVKADDRYDGRPLVFARPWYPGYHVYLDGTEIHFDLLASLVPAITLPPNFQGTLTVSFVPKSLIFGSFAAVLALIAALGLQYRWRNAARPCGNPPVMV